MTVQRFLLACLLLVLTGAALADASPSARVIVKLKSDSSLLVDNSRAQVLEADRNAADPSRMHRLGVKAGMSLVDGMQLAPRVHVAHASGLSSEALAAKLSKLADVEYAEVDQRAFARALPNDPLFAASVSHAYVPTGQWYLNAPDSTTPAAINAVGAWDQTFGSSSVTVAVLDTGVRLDHEDLSGKFLNGYNMISDGANAGNGNVGRSSDPSDLGDYLTLAEKNANLTAFSACKVNDNSTWHGTQVSGIVGAATNNALGVAGTGGHTRVLPLRVLGKCGGYSSDIIAAMRWAVGLSVPGVSTSPTQVAKVINLSLGSVGTCSRAYQDAVTAVRATGAVIVAAAGNHVQGGSDAVESPANCTGVIAVGGLRHTGTKVGYSAVGTGVTLSAPGGNCVNATGACVYPILTTTNSGTQAPVAHTSGGSTYSDNGSDATLGTSFSAPMVSGTVALMLAVRPSLTPDSVSTILQRTARPFPTTGAGPSIGTCQGPSETSVQDECYCTTSTCGAGMLDASAAVAMATTGYAAIAYSPTQPLATVAVNLNGSGSLYSATGTHIVSYQWQLIDGGGIVSSLGGDLTSASVTATPSAAGTFQVRLTVTDDANVTSVVDQSITVAALPVSSGGGGGGAIDDLTLLFGLILTGVIWGTRQKH